MLTIRELQHLKLLGESVSVADAAGRAGISASAISQSLSSAEAKLNSQLFIRRRGSLIATRSGLAVLQRVAVLLNEVAALETDLADITRAERSTACFGIGHAVANLFLNEVLEVLCNQVEGILPRFHVGLWDSCEAKLLSREIDVFIGGFPRSPDDQRFDYQPFYKDDLVAVASDAHPLASGEPVSLEDLIHYPILSMNARLDSAWQALSSTFDLEVFRRNIPASVMPDPFQYLTLVSQTDHILLAPRLNWRVVKADHPDLVDLQVDRLRGTAHMCFVTLAGMDLSDPCTRVIQAFKDRFDEKWQRDIGSD